jgi:hypothetical protein
MIVSAATTHLLLCLCLFLSGAFLVSIALALAFTAFLFSMGLFALLSCHFLILAAWLSGRDPRSTKHAASWILVRTVSTIRIFRTIVRASVTAGFSVGEFALNLHLPRRLRSDNWALSCESRTTATATASSDSNSLGDNCLRCIVYCLCPHLHAALRSPGRSAFLFCPNKIRSHYPL